MMMEATLNGIVLIAYKNKMASCAQDAIFNANIIIGSIINVGVKLNGNKKR